MMSYLNQFYHQVLSYANQLSPQQWVMVLMLMIVFGLFCLKGFGSRSNY